MKIVFHAQGQVQGVGFRYFVQHRAMMLGLAGWVRNEPDGSVCGTVEGNPQQLKIFHRVFLQAPGQLKHLDWQPTDEGESLPHPFEIRR